MGIMFRYEHKDGKGPYTSYTPEKGDKYWKVIGELEGHCAKNRHPGPQDDIGMCWEDCFNSKFGCHTIKQLFAWFDGLNDDLITLGFRIFKYDCKYIEQGTNQCACKSYNILDKIDVTDEVLKELKNA